MAVFLRIDLNIAAAFLLSIVLILAWRRLDPQDTLNRAFLRTSMIVVVQLIIETLTCVINKLPYPWLIPVAGFLHTCLFSVSPILTYYWYTIVRSMVLPDTPGSLKRDIFILLPVLFNTALAVLSPKFNFLFYVDSANVYHRGDLFYLSAVLIYVYLLAGTLLIILKKSKIIHQEWFPLCIFSLLPTIGGIIQILFYGPLVMWSATAFSLLIVFIFLQERMVHLDHLTGAWSRGSFDNHLSRRVKLACADPFGIIYIDIDRLKDINDQFGHTEGDAALKTIISVIKGAIRKSDIVARLGGDEFGIVMECVAPDALEKAVLRIEAELVNYNHRSQRGYLLQCSIGYDIYNSEKGSLDDFMRHIDGLMYKNKKAKKALVL